MNFDPRELNKIHKDPIKRFFSVAAPLIQERIDKLTDMAPFGVLYEAQNYGYVSFGDWSTHDLLFYLLQHSGPSNLYFSTWGISETAVRLIFKAKESGLIKNLYVVVDRRIEIRNSAVNALLDRCITEKAMTDCHAKVFVIESKDYVITNMGSANMSNNRRIETGHISFTPSVGHFHRDWIMDEIKKGRYEFEKI